MSGQRPVVSVCCECKGGERMQNWMDGFQKSIDYIESNLDGEAKIEEIAGFAALSLSARLHYGQVCPASPEV